MTTSWPGSSRPDIVVVPVYFALDDVTAAIQITDHYIPLGGREPG